VKRVKRLIFGVDPGTTTAVAAVSLDGKLVAVTSKKGFGYSGVVRWILEHGRATILSTDRKRVPDFVSRIASVFNCPVYAPDENLTMDEKLSLSARYKIEDSHQRDAISAALAAFEHHVKTIKKIDLALEKLGKQSYANDVKDLVIRKRLNVSSAIDRVLGRCKKKHG
jgi:hypothetical protein